MMSRPTVIGNPSSLNSARVPGVNDLRTISLDYDRFIFNKVKEPEKVNHIIRKAIKWKKMLNDGVVNSMSEIARKEGFTRARVTQIMNLLKLRAEMQVPCFQTAS